MPDPRQVDPERLRVVLDHDEVVDLDGGTLVLDGEESPSLVLRLAPWRARSVARVQDAADGGGSHAVAKLEQLALDSLVSPPGILPGHALDQLGHNVGDGRGVQGESLRRSVLL